MKIQNEAIKLGKALMTQWELIAPNENVIETLEQAELNGINIKDLLVFLLKEGHWFFYAYLIGLRKELLRLNYVDLKEMLEFFSVYRRNSVMRFLENFLESTYMFLGIDLLHEYAQVANIDRKDQQITLQYYYERPGVFCRDEYKDELEGRGLSFEVFLPAQNKLLNQGAKRAEVIDPKPHTEIKYGCKLFSAQGVPPLSWEWTKGIEKNWIEGFS